MLKDPNIILSFAYKIFSLKSWCGLTVIKSPKNLWSSNKQRRDFREKAVDYQYASIFD